jgi:uncharacterized circularly permuted ATP-grasp superfamily protein
MGTVALVNGGNGAVDDKVICLCPDMICYYLNEEPILKNVPTLPQMENLEEREFVFADMGNMVIKKNGSGGYGMVMGN